MSNKPKQEKRDKSNKIVGGFAFFLSLAALMPTGILFFLLALTQISNAEPKLAIGFISSCIFGAVLAHALIKGHISVLIHEFKHALISNLVGNKNKKMRIERDSGHLEYAYTKKTAHYNAFIALAPYIVPASTFVAILLALAIARGNPLLMVTIIGIGYGGDLMLNARDISPVQTDISLIRGGYYMGLAYILSWNLLTTALILAWAFQGASGIAELFTSVIQALFNLYFTISGKSASMS